MSLTHTEVAAGESIGSIAKRLAPTVPRAQQLAFGAVLAQRNGYPGVGATIYPKQILWYMTEDLPTVVTPPVDPPVDPPPTGTGVIPARTAIGPRSTLVAGGSTNLTPGVYQGKKWVERDSNGNIKRLVLAPGQYTFIDCEMSFDVVNPGRTVTLDHCKVNGGIWFEDQNGAGGHTGWTIKWTELNGGTGQALRPKGPGTIHVSDSWLLTAGTPLGQSIHTESFQAMSGANVIADRVAFSCEPRWSGTETPITAVQTFEAAGDGAGSTLTDCTFGHWSGTAWVGGGGYYAIYPGKAAYVRPTVYHNGAGHFLASPRVLVDPILR